MLISDILNLTKSPIYSRVKGMDQASTWYVFFLLFYHDSMGGITRILIDLLLILLRCMVLFQRRAILFMMISV